MIIHIFTAERFHLVPTILKGFLKLKTPQFYILARDKKDENDYKYIDLFKDHNTESFKITYSFEELRNISKKYKNDKIILHGVPYQWMLYYYLNRFKDVNWICWGTGASINRNSWKSIIATPFKKYLYRSFNRVGVLMNQDAISLKQDFNTKNITLLSYFGSLDSFPYSEDHLSLEMKEKEKKVIYLGNNSHCLPTYLNLIEKLDKYKGKIKISCMLNYSFEESETSRALEEKGIKLYGSDFLMDTKLRSLNDYYAHMDKCDIYICDVKTQSGLGALYTCLRLGKKVFLSGINHEWISHLGCFIYHVDDITNMNEKEFMEELPYEAKIKNFRAINSYLDKNRIIKEWEQFFL